MPRSELALDASVRTYDTDGRLHIARTRISKATVNPYFGSEIPGSQALGLQPDRVYQLLRDPDELAKAAPTFARNQLLVKHIPVTADDPQREVIGGTIGSNVEFEDPYLWADVCIWDAAAIAGIETDTVREFSCAYHYVPDMTPGVYQGMPYDGVMREIRGNHLAVVESGRAGSDVLAADEDITMKMTKLGKALFLTLGGMSPKLAQDSALPGLVGKASKKTVNATELAPKLIAIDSELDAEKLQKTLAALLALDAEKEEKPKPAEDEDDEDDTAQDEDEDDDEEEKKRKKKDKPAEDEEEKKEKEVKAAMDSFRKELREADEARRLVRPVVGDVIAQDSADQIYGFALDHLKVAREGVTGTPALKALFTLASSRTASTSAPAIAQDAAGLVSKFPNAARFSQQ